MSWLSKSIGKLADWTGDIFNRATGQTQANQWQWDMWNAQNEYNSPAAQRARLEAAGYNPMLMNSAGSSASGNAGSMTAKSGSGISPFEVMNSLVNARYAMSQADFIAEQTRKLRHDNNLVEGSPVKSDDNSLFGKIGRLFKWSNSDEGKKAIETAKEKAGGLFQGASIPKSSARQAQDASVKKKINRVLSDNLVKLRPGQRLDELMYETDVLSRKLGPRDKLRMLKKKIRP